MKKFFPELEKGCSTKTQEWKEVRMTRAEELVFLANTVKVLADDAPELYGKKTKKPELEQASWRSK